MCTDGYIIYHSSNRQLVWNKRKKKLAVEKGRCNIFNCAYNYYEYQCVGFDACKIKFCPDHLVRCQMVLGLSNFYIFHNSASLLSHYDHLNEFFINDIGYIKCQIADVFPGKTMKLCINSDHCFFIKNLINCFIMILDFQGLEISKLQIFKNKNFN